MKKTLILLTLLVIGLVVGAYWRDLLGLGPIVSPVPTPTTPSSSTNTTGMPLLLPPGFAISTIAKDLPDARVLAFDQSNNLWVSQTSADTVSQLLIKDGTITSQSTVLENLNKPHGLAFDPKQPSTLYVAEEGQIIRISANSTEKSEKIVDLPSDGGHSTRTLGFGPDGNLYVSIGSSCNVCHETDDRRAKIFTVNIGDKTLTEFARGLRNTVFFTWHPTTKKLWGTDMGRDLLGDDLPPDEVNIIEKDGNYGWPVCYGDNIHDTNFDKNTYIRNPCMAPFERPSFIDIPAHSAPLGLAFITNLSWPVEYQGDLLVSYHGSWNRTVPTGYKVVRMKFDDAGHYQGTEDFITGWHTDKALYGRPVDLLFGHDGNLYLSDDRAGVIYKISYQGVY